MKKTTLLLVIISVLMVNTIKAQQDYNVRVGDLLNKSDWFTLREEFPCIADSIDPMLRSFAKAMLAHNFCTPDSACDAFDQLLRHYSQHIGTENAIAMTILQSAHLARKGDYANAHHVLTRLISENHLGEGSNGYIQEIAQQYAALDSIGGIHRITQSAEEVCIPFDIDTIWTKDKSNYAIMLKAKVNERPFRILFDTGAGVNVISHKAAKLLGVDALNINTSAHGFGRVQGSFAVVDKIEMGGMTIENVPFQMFTIETGIDSIDRYMQHIDIIIGVQFMNLTDELHIDIENRQLKMPSKPSQMGKDEQINLCGGVQGLYTILANINGTPLTVHFDTGAGSSTLLYKYYQRYKAEIEANYPADTLRQAGAGGVRIEKSYRIPHVNFTVNNVPYVFSKLHVGTTAVENTPGHANIGMDYFCNFSKIIFNFKHHFVRLIERGVEDANR